MKRFDSDCIREQFGDAPTLVAWVEGHLIEHGGTLSTTLVDAVDESPFSLRQWVEALVVMGEWLQSHRYAADLDDQIGYIGCACASVRTNPVEESLPFLVEEMLAEYGFDRANPKEESGP